MRTKIAGVDKRVVRHFSSASSEMPAFISQATLNNTAWIHSHGEMCFAVSLGHAGAIVPCATEDQGVLQEARCDLASKFIDPLLVYRHTRKGLAMMFCHKKLMPRW